MIKRIFRKKRPHNHAATLQHHEGSSFRRAFKMMPMRFAVVVFTLFIFVWTALLALPISSANGVPVPVVDALFTAVNAICVTGLTTVDMSTRWSFFGNTLIVLGTQVGAVGVVSLASILGLTITRRLGLKQRLLSVGDMTSNARKESSQNGSTIKLSDMRGLLAIIVTGTIVIESTLAVLFFPRLLVAGYSVGDAIAYSIYLACSSFTNTGFFPLQEGVGAFTGDFYFLGIMAVGVFIGSLGFPVIFSLWMYITGGGWKAHKRLNLHAKLTITTSLILFVFGWILIAVLEWANMKTFGPQDNANTLFHSAYMSIMTRSGGFAVVEPDAMQNSTHLVIDLLMFVGGGSASTAGGIKVTTFAILFLSAWAEARGYQNVQVFGRRIPAEMLRVAVSLVIWGTLIVCTSTVILTFMTGQPLDRVVFEVVSAFGSCGLSTGLSEELPAAGKVILVCTIWIGRVGTVTLAAALASTSRSRLYSYPEERPIVG